MSCRVMSCHVMSWLSPPPPNRNPQLIASSEQQAATLSLRSSFWCVRPFSLFTLPSLSLSLSLSLFLLPQARVIVASQAWMGEILELCAAGLCANLQFVVQIERLGYDEQVRAQELGLPIYDFEFVETKGRRNLLPVEPPTTDDVYTIVYRWHSETCEPIGWEVNHGNLAANANAFGDLYRFSPTERHFSYVPMSHIGERVVLAACLQNGARIGVFMADSRLIYADVRKLRPTFLLSTPQSFATPFSVAAAALERAPLRYWATAFALRCKRRSRQRGGCGRKWLVNALDALIFRKFMAQMGGRVKRILVLSDATLNYMDHHLEKHTELILDCPVYKALVLPEVGGFLALSSQQQQPPLPAAAAAEGRGGVGYEGMLLHSALDFKLKPLGLKLGYGRDCYELLIKGSSLSKPIAAKTAAADAVDGAGSAAAAGGGLRRPAMKRADSVTFDQLEWVHSGIICEHYSDPGNHRRRRHGGDASQSSSNWIVRFNNVVQPQRPLAKHGGASAGQHDEDSTVASGLRTTSMALRIVGRVSSIIHVGPERTPLLAEEVERVYRARSKLIRQIWCHAAAEWQQVARPREGWPTDGEGTPAVGLCAVISVDHEEVYKWAAGHELDLLRTAQAMDDLLLLQDDASERAVAATAVGGYRNSSRLSEAHGEGGHDNAGGSSSGGVAQPQLQPDQSIFAGGIANQEMELLCTLRQLRAELLTDLQRIHTEEDSLPPHAQVLAVHLTSEPFSATNKLQTPNFRLCRPNLLKRYGSCFESRSSGSIATARTPDSTAARSVRQAGVSLVPREITTTTTTTTTATTTTGGRPEF
eukprot:COSAG05_NODE_938_length_6518_cov_21.709456_1_plen_817_part_00